MNDIYEFEDLDEDAPQVVTYARNPQEAETLRVLLEDHDIPVTVSAEDVPPVADKHKGIAIMVPAELLADAKEVIQERTIVDSEFADHLEEFDGEDEDEDEDELDGFGPDLMDDDLFDEDDHHDDYDELEYDDSFDDDNLEELY
ncbi:MAG: hypothetical protein JW936_08545 [Sedimentisphaerales bacterium]|nr:hypothetical protein [Sedimentisphaerales bacterium]